MSGIAVTISSARLREIAGQMKEDFAGNIYQFLELAANTIDLLSGVSVPGIAPDEKPVGFAVRNANGTETLTRETEPAPGGIALFKTPLPYAYLVEGFLQWTKSENGSGTPVFTRDPRAVPPDDRLDGSVSEAKALNKLRETLGLQETDATVTMNNAAVRIQRLSAEAAQFAATGSILPQAVVDRVQAAVDAALQRGTNVGSATKGTFNPLDVQRVLNAVLGNPTGDPEEPVNAQRYKHVRTLTPQQFGEVYKENLQSGKPFDTIIDERRSVGAPAACVDAFVSEHPTIGSAAWLNLIADSQMAEACRLLQAKTPVVVQNRDETGKPMWAVMFKDTDFWADAFEAQSDAEAYAKAWNDSCVGSPLTQNFERSITKKRQ